jgi:uncharacterized protein YjbJ (UPF0337 family)
MSERTRVEGELDEVKGNVESAVGRATGDKRLEGEGLLDDVTGHLKQAAADVQDKIEDIARDIRDR